MLAGNKPPDAIELAASKRPEGEIFVLLKSGRLFGPFMSITLAIAWVDKNAKGAVYSTYSLNDPSSIEENQ